jgi:hypothetical protein
MTKYPWLWAAGAALTLAAVARPAAAQDETREASDEDEWFEEEPPVYTEPPAEEEGQAAQAPAEEPGAEPPLTSPRAEPSSLPPTQMIRGRPDWDRPRRYRRRGEDLPRFRGGFGALFGFAQYPEDEELSFLVGMEGRFGLQASDTIAIYATPSIIGSRNVRLAAGMVLEATFGNIFSLGAGLDGIVASEARFSNLDERWNPGTGLQGRAGLHFGKNKPSRRKVFSMIATGKVDFYLSGDTIPMFGMMLGYDAM